MSLASMGRPGDCPGHRPRLPGCQGELEGERPLDTLVVVASEGCQDEGGANWGPPGMSRARGPDSLGAREDTRGV